MYVCKAWLCPLCPIDFSLLCGAGLSWYQQQFTIKYTGRTKLVFEPANTNCGTGEPLLAVELLTHFLTQTASLYVVLSGSFYKR